ncbi:MAG: bifunctional 2-C-methyl-D-erythritol 4-phosphate cytidylyltransferase/2-C-methyl-D-erythritol 2,4-cyclodiphosphate synthase [Campylobacteraceae bacterium]|nr:bifunctional 2-C-methyl-D-erythritol 4-phosphate cytidylyltransferase/2-C-methyl-D-erythritol 2,4-cyclodiphosphate synthase [Campylobacteraceae bacterium]
MPDLSLIMLGAGNSTRFKHKIKKQWLRFGDTPLWLFATQNIIKNHKFNKIIVTAHKNEIRYMEKYANDFIFVEGGESRQESLRNALAQVNTPFVLVSDVARVFINDSMLTRIIEQKGKADIVVPYLGVSDTVIYNNNTIDREKVKLIQTPQLSNTKILKEALNTKTQYTDDSSAIKAVGGIVTYVKGDTRAKKLTFLEDLEEIAKNQMVNQDIFTGFGFDVHAFKEGKVMMLCGVKIQDSPGFKAHSDGDVAIHALIDSLLGAIGAGDIGELFPDTDAKYKNIDSKKLLKKVYGFVTQVGYEIINCDITIMAQTPKLGRFKDKMRETIANILQIKPIYVNIKATTTEKLGFIGRSEGISVQANSNLKFLDWKNK